MNTAPHAGAAEVIASFDSLLTAIEGNALGAATSGSSRRSCKG